MKKLKFKFKIQEIKLQNLEISKINNKQINIINVNFKNSKTFDKISSKSNNYIEKSCDVALELLKRTSSKVLINGQFLKNFFK